MSEKHLEIIDRDPYFKTRRRKSKILKGKKQKEERYFVCPRCGKEAPYPSGIGFEKKCPHCELWYMWRGKDYLIISEDRFKVGDVTHKNLGTEGDVL